MMFSFVIFFVLVAHAGSVMSGKLKPQNIFLLAGQSNMAGRGGVYNNTNTNLLKWDGIVPSKCTSSTNILSLSLNKTREVARDPLHKEIDNLKTCGVGPGMSFANQILSKCPGLGVIGLVPCAVRGTKIEKWQKGTILYNQLVVRARAARQSGGNIRALLWYQGESECGEWDSRLYLGRLTKFFNDVRHNIDSPDLPILLVVTSTGEGRYLRNVRAARLKINLRNFVHVDSAGSTLLPSHLHLDTKSTVCLGKKLDNIFFPIFITTSN